MADPTAVSGLSVWFKADGITGLADAAQISTWTDALGTSTAAQTTASKRPTYRTNVLNGKPVVRYAAASSQRFALTGTAASFSNAVAGITTFVVAKPVSTPASGVGLQAIWYSRGQSGGARLLLGYSNTSTWYMSVRRLDAEASPVRVDSPATATVNTWRVVTGVTDYTGGVGTVYLNGTAGTANTAFPGGGNTSATNSNSVAMGSDANDTAEYFDGDIAEVLTYDRVLTAVERATVHTYLQDKYGITVADYAGGFSKTVTGSVAAAGTALRTATKRPAGTVTGTAAAPRRAFARLLSGTVDSVGTKTGRTIRNTSFGAIFLTGNTQRGYPRTVSGLITAAGVVGKRSAGRFFFGTVTAVGTAAKATVKRHAGTSQPAGTATRTPRLFKTGSVTGSGAPNQLGVRIRSFVASLTMSGTAARVAVKKPAATVTPAGVFRSRSFTKRPKGVITATAATAAALFRRVFGRSGTSVVSIGTAAELDIVFYLRQRAQVTVQLETAGGKPLVRDADAFLLSGSLFRATAAETPARSNLTSGSEFTGTLSITGAGYGAGYTGGF